MTTEIAIAFSSLVQVWGELESKDNVNNSFKL